MKQVSLEELVVQARAGDLDAFTELVARFQDFVYGLAYHLSGSFEDARDLAQESFVRAYQRLGSLREPRGFPAWLRQVTLSVCHNALPSLRRGRAASLDEAVAGGFDPPDPAPGPDVQAAGRDLRGRVLAAVRALPEGYALPLTLYYLNGMSSAAVGEFLGLSTGTVKMRLHRARNLVRQELAPMFEDAFEGSKLADDFPRSVRGWIVHLERGYDQGCRLLNPEVLRFERDPGSGLMVAIPSAPLVYRNDDLGFLVTVHTRGVYLRDHGPFGHGMKSETVEELEPASEEEARRWADGRRARFQGSLPHFLYAWMHQREAAEGFSVLEPLEGTHIRPCTPDLDPPLGSDRRYELVVPGGVLRVACPPAGEVGVLYLRDGWAEVRGHSTVNGNWWTEGYWDYRSGYGLSRRFLVSELLRLREDWGRTGPVSLRPVAPPLPPED